jgi:hypothetical protein
MNKIKTRNTLVQNIPHSYNVLHYHSADIIFQNELTTIVRVRIVRKLQGAFCTPHKVCYYFNYKL